ncbi:type VI secretion system contractile sheath domain-containing protein, partial [Petrachloros mirabilis]
MFLRSIVGPYLVPDADPRAPQLIGQIDGLLGAIVREVLHHPAWQSLEATWYGVKFLVDRLETDAQLQLYLFDVTKDELFADLCTGNDLTTTGLYRHLVNDTVRTSGGIPWAVIGGIYSFDRSETDVGLLHRMAGIAHAAGAPFIAEGSPTIAGCPSFSTSPDSDDWDDHTGQEKDLDRWNNLRKTPEANALGLALPRFLLRLPYGKDTEPIESFPLEEAIGSLPHEEYLWGNPVFICLLLLGQAFTTDGWGMQPGTIKDIEGLPIHIHPDESGASVTTACAEAWLNEKAAERLLDEGLMPLVCYKDQDRIRLIRFQSLASPPTS